MRKCSGVIVVSIALAFAGCSRDDSGQRTSASREAGRVAYQLSQETKRAAEKAREDLRKAGNDARQGWNEARHEAKTKPKAPEPVRRRD
jgi:Tfp pilus assembly protein PilF